MGHLHSFRRQRVTVRHTGAVIFDLFGTLIPNFSQVEYQAMAEETATVVGAPMEEFVRVYMHNTYPLRLTGELVSAEANIEYVCQRLGVRPKPERVAEAARLRIELTRRTLLAPLPGAVPALRELRESGYRIGLLRDCSAEVPLLWPETELAALIDEPVFSCKVGLRKPDPRLYQLVCERLGFEPAQCLYVADGSGKELSGAIVVGMRAALIRVEYDETTDADRPEVPTWKGLELQALADVLAVVEKRHQ